MKTRLSDTTALIDFTPRNICFAEQDADDGAGGGGAAPADNDDGIDVALDEEDPPAAGAEDADDDSDELEIGPTKHRVPKPVKEAWHGLQKSTQSEKEAIAAEKKAIAEEKARYQENMRVASTYVKEIGKIQAIDEQIAEYEKLTPADWMAWAAQDEKAANKAQIGYNALMAEKSKLIRSVQEKETTIRTQRDREQQEFIAKAERELATKIKDWSPQKRETLFKVANDYGYSADELKAVAHDFRLYAVLEDAHKYREAKERARKAVADAKAEAAATAGKPEPVTRTRGTAGGTTSLADNVSTDNWAERFKKQRAVHLKTRMR